MIIEVSLGQVRYLPAHIGYQSDGFIISFCNKIKIIGTLLLNKTKLLVVKISLVLRKSKIIKLFNANLPKITATLIFKVIAIKLSNK